MSDIVKCLVWDLDHTLWPGVLSEDGETPLREGILEVVRELDRRGILQSVASKNDADLALARLEALGVAEYFVLPQIHWNPKSGSIRQIAEDLQFATKTIAFIDDQPAERAEVNYHLPEVRVYDAAEALDLLQRPEFSPATVTVDSRRRRQMYQAGFRREATRAEFTGSDDDFLRSLDLRMQIGPASDEEISRVEELTLRTSQMNATGVHYSDATLRSLLADPDHEVLVMSMQDRFGPHGAVGVMLLRRYPEAWHLKLLATSCRVVSFGAGSVILSWLNDQAARAGVHLLADFRPTDRNRMMEVAYRFGGFDDEDCGCRTDLPAPQEPGEGQEPVQRLHLKTSPQPASTTVTVTAPDLTR